MTTLLRPASEPVDLVFSGSGTLLPCHIGAWAALLDNGIQPVRVAGTSGGGIVAAGIAYGWTPPETLSLAKKFLAGGLLDPSLWFFDRWGVHKWEKIRKLLGEHLPKTLGEAKIPLTVFVVDLELQKSLPLSSTSHPKILAADALAATSAIPAFAKARKLPTVPGTFIDGGTSTNFAMGVFDDAPERRTIGIRLVGTPRRRKVTNVGEWAVALVGAMHEAANHSYVSKKRWANVIEVKSKGNGMDFTLGDSEVQMLYDEGYAAATLWAKGALS